MALKVLAGIHAKRRTSPATQDPQIVTTDAKNGTATTVHTLTGIQAGVVFVVTTQCETHSGACVVSSTPTLTWTRRVKSAAVQSGDCEIWTSSVFAAGGNITITSDWDGNVQSSVCYALKNVDANFGGATGLAFSQALPSVTVASSKPKSILFCVTSDWNAVNGTSRVYRSLPVNETQYFFSLNATTGYHYFKAAPTASSYTLGLTAPNMVNGANNGAGTCVLEARAPAATGPDTQPPTAPVLTVGTISSTSIIINWTASTDDVAVTGYDIYRNNTLFGTTSGTTFTLTNLTASTQYSIFVKAKDAAGNTTNSNTITPTTSAPSSATLIYSNGFNTNADLDPFDHGQIGGGSLSTTNKVEGAGSFHSVPANVSSGIRSEVQFDAPQTPLEGIFEWNVYYETIFQDNGHSFQFHPETSGGSASPGLWHEGAVLNWVNWKGGTNTHYTTGHHIIQNHWYQMRLEIKFGTAGYIRFYIDGVQVLNKTNIQVGDGSGQYMKVGTNQWEAQPSSVYYDNLKVYTP